MDHVISVFSNEGSGIGSLLIGCMAVLICLLMLLAGRLRNQSLVVRQILQSNSELQGRLGSMTEMLGQRQQELNASLSERIDGLTGRIGNTLHVQAQATHQNLQQLHQRLAVIDAAQNNIQTLAKDMAGLQAILANKQTRGAFGQVRMEAIIADGLPQGSFQFQATLSNQTRPDCVIRMPNGGPSLVVDAKFPLEAWNAFRQAREPERRLAAAQQFRRDMDLHIRTIAEKYLIPGETQETAFLFVPSESIFADIHENFEAIVQKAQRARIMIVSPSLLMLSVQLMQAILKDQRMQEQAHLIQAEIGALVQDLARLDDRVGKLQSHFQQAQKDVEGIAISTGKIARRGERITELDLQPSKAEVEPATPSQAPFAESRSGNLRLRVVDED